MRACIVSLFLLLAVTGSWGILLHPFLLGQPPQQQFFYPPPQRHIGQEQFFYYPHMRSPIANPYQQFNYLPAERNPYTYYNAPVAARYPLYPSYRDSYSPVIQYIYQQAPLQPVQSNPEYGEKVPEPASKNCDDVIEIQIEPEVVDRQSQEIPMDQMFKGPTIVSMSDQPTEVSMEQTFKGPTMATLTEPPVENPVQQMSKDPTIVLMSEQPKETTEDKMSEEVSAIVMSSQPMENANQDVSEGDIRTIESMPSEPKLTESVQQQEADVVVVESAEVPVADVMSMENSSAESTTVAQ